MHIPKRALSFLFNSTCSIFPKAYLYVQYILKQKKKWNLFQLLKILGTIFRCTVISQISVIVLYKRYFPIKIVSLTTTVLLRLFGWECLL